MSYSSEYAVLYNSSSGAVRSALAAIPGVDDLTAALKRVGSATEAHRKTVVATDHTAELVEAIVATVEAGGVVPDDLAEQVATAQQKAALTATTSAVLQAVEGRVGSDRDTATRGGRDAALALLHTQMLDTLARGRKLDLKGAQVAAEAIELGVPDAWRTLTSLTGEYDQIRAAQAQLMRTLAPNTDPRKDDFGWLRNVSDVYPAWYAYRNGHYSRAGGHYIAPPPWPDAPGDRYRWLVATESAVPWVPTPSQLAEAVSLATEAALAAERTPEEQRAHEAAQKVAQKRQNRQVERAASAASIERQTAHPAGMGQTRL